MSSNNTTNVVLNSFLGSRYIIIKELPSQGAQSVTYLARMPMYSNELVVLKRLRTRVPSPTNDFVVLSPSKQKSSSQNSNSSNNNNDNNDNANNNDFFPFDSTIEVRVNEIQALSVLRHQNIIRFREAWFEKSDSFLYIATEYCAGSDLEQYMKRNAHQIFPLPESVLRNWLLQILVAVDYMHCYRVVHRDIALKNIFVIERNNNNVNNNNNNNQAPPILRIGDFGLARILSSSNEGVETSSGTFFFMSPEVILGTSHGFKTDIWSVGVAMFVLMTRRYPFQGNSFLQLAENIRTQEKIDFGEIEEEEEFENNQQKQQQKTTKYSKELFEIVRAMLTKDAKKRPSAASLIATKYLQIALQEEQQYETQTSNNNQNNNNFCRKENSLSSHINQNNQNENNNNNNNSAASSMMLRVSPVPATILVSEKTATTTTTKQKEKSKKKNFNNNDNDDEDDESQMRSRRNSSFSNNNNDRTSISRNQQQQENYLQLQTCPRIEPFSMQLLKFRIPSSSSSSTSRHKNNNNNNANDNNILTVNIRSAPSLHSNIVGKLFWGDQIIAVDIIRQNQEEEEESVVSNTKSNNNSNNNSGGIFYRISDPVIGYCIATLAGRPLFGTIVVDHHLEVMYNNNNIANNNYNSYLPSTSPLSTSSPNNNNTNNNGNNSFSPSPQFNVINDEQQQQQEEEEKVTKRRNKNYFVMRASPVSPEVDAVGEQQQFSSASENENSGNTNNNNVISKQSKRSSFSRISSRSSRG